MDPVEKKGKESKYTLFYFSFGKNSFLFYEEVFRHMTSCFMGFYTFVCNCRYLKLIPFQKIYDTISKSDLVNLTMKPYVMMVLSKKPIVYELLKMKWLCTTLLKIGFLIRNHDVSVIGNKLTNHFSCWINL